MVFDHGELVGRRKVIVQRFGKVDQPHPVAALRAFILVAHRHTLCQQAVEGLVVGQQVGRTDALHLLERGLQNRFRHLGVDAPQRGFQPPCQQHVVVMEALRPLAVRRDVRRIDNAVPQPLEQLKRELLDGGLGHLAGHITTSFS